MHCKLSEDELRHMYYDKKMSQWEIGDLVGVSNASISLCMKEYGIESRMILKSQSVALSKPLKEELGEMYLDNKMSMPEIAKRCGVSTGTVVVWMHEYRIESRTFSESLIGKHAGKNNPGWINGDSFLLYCYRFNNKFKEAVRERDYYTCQLCGLEQKSNGRKLDVHHIHYDKENCYPDVVALCRSCHAKIIPGNRNYWEEYFENLLIERGLHQWSISY